jgi:predicted small lipoprotein YifL
MRTSIFLPALGLLALTLSGCGKGSLFNRDAPDEMAVSRKPPLVIPPEFNLVPPEAGSAEAQNTDLQKQALDALFGGPAPRSPGETSTLDRAGRDVATPGIRSNVGDPATKIINKGAVTRNIIAAPEGDGQNARAAAGQ